MLRKAFILTICLLALRAWGAETREELISFDAEWEHFAGDPSEADWMNWWTTVKAPFETELRPDSPNTFLFRKAFEVEKADGITSLLLEILYPGRGSKVDLFINGKSSLSLPRREYPEYMRGMHGDAVQEAIFDLPPSLLREGINRIGVSISVFDPELKKLSFALRLAAGRGFHIVKGPYLQSVTAEGATVVWETDVPSSSRVIYGETPLMGFEAGDGSPKTLHEVRLTGLKPNTTYFYYVISELPPEGDFPSDMPRYVWSGINSFKTAPPPGKPFKFVVYGDSRSNPDVHAGLVKLMMKAEPDLILHTGDLVGNGRYYSQWDEQFFEPLKPLISSVPIWPAIGNHERSHYNFFRFFSLPGNEAWYSFDWGDAHFLVIDTEYDFGPGSEQYEFIERDLSESKAKWKFVFFHKPPYTAVPRRFPGNTKVREILGPLFERYGVDMVFCGHDHNYVRSKPINGVIYVITGGGGAGLYEVVPVSWAEVARAAHHFCFVRIGDPEEGTTDSLEMFAVDREGRVIDRIKLRKE